jgi:hypothetical protein
VVVDAVFKDLGSWEAVITVRLLVALLANLRMHILFWWPWNFTYRGLC